MQTSNERLIDFLDKQVNQEDSEAIRNEIQNDTSVGMEFQYLSLAVDTIRRDVIQSKVSAIRNAYEMQADSAEKPKKAIVRNIFKTSLRIASIFVLLAGLTVLYKFISVNNQSIYNKEFTQYELPTLRGNQGPDVEGTAYRDNKWKDVLMIFQQEKHPTNRTALLAALSEMQLNHFSNAVSLFENILNGKYQDTEFREESEFYLSLAYLMNNQTNKSVLLINKMKADPRHRYYPIVSKISKVDLKIVESKE